MGNWGWFESRINAPQNRGDVPRDLAFRGAQKTDFFRRFSEVRQIGKL
jgi:hypothetical protein